MYVQEHGEYRKIGNTLFKAKVNDVGQKFYVVVSHYAGMPKNISHAIQEHEEHKNINSGACHYCGLEGMAIYRHCRDCGEIQ